MQLKLHCFQVSLVPAEKQLRRRAFFCKDHTRASNPLAWRPHRMNPSKQHQGTLHHQHTEKVQITADKL